jgi:hypothetical protein
MGNGRVPVSKLPHRIRSICIAFGINSPSRYASDQETTYTQLESRRMKVGSTNAPLNN